LGDEQGGRWSQGEGERGASPRYTLTEVDHRIRLGHERGRKNRGGEYNQAMVTLSKSTEALRSASSGKGVVDQVRRGAWQTCSEGETCSVRGHAPSKPWMEKRRLVLGEKATSDDGDGVTVELTR
jgi:hypothetical protein